MARKAWESLSPGYRQRLERAGMTRQDFKQGRPLAAARGHGATPEHPHRYDPAKYPKYHRERVRLEKQLQARKRMLWGASPRWDDDRSERHIRESLVSLQRLRDLMSLDDEEIIDAARETSDTYKLLYYH